MRAVDVEAARLRVIRKLARWHARRLFLRDFLCGGVVHRSGLAFDVHRNNITQRDGCERGGGVENRRDRAEGGGVLVDDVPHLHARGVDPRRRIGACRMTVNGGGGSDFPALGPRHAVVIDVQVIFKIPLISGHVATPKGEIVTVVALLHLYVKGYAGRVAMAEAHTFTASGQGSLVINGGAIQTILEVDAHIITPADFAVLTGVSPVRRVHQQCFYGIGFTAGGGPLVGAFIISWAKYLETEDENHLTQAFAQPQADTLFWDVKPGGVMYFEVDW